MPGKKTWDWSWRDGTTVGFHLTLNPQTPLPPSVAIYRQFLGHGLVVSGPELESILKGRDEGIRIFGHILKKYGPNLGPDLTLKLSTSLADALLEKSLRGQLSREFPTGLERLAEKEEKLRYVQGQKEPGSLFLPQLFDKLPPVGAGFSLTIHF